MKTVRDRGGCRVGHASLRTLEPWSATLGMRGFSVGDRSLEERTRGGEPLVRWGSCAGAGSVGERSKR
jgi:hypothetical protein